MSDGVSIRITPNSIKTVTRNMRARAANVETAGVMAIHDFADTIRYRAYLSCPRDTNTLVASLFMEEDWQDNNISARVGHGGKYAQRNPDSGKSSDEYAVEVHESPKIRRTKNNRGASWKWLEKAANSVRPEFLDVLGIYIGHALAGDNYEGMKRAATDYRVEAHASLMDRRRQRREKLEAIRRKKGMPKQSEKTSSKKTYTSSLENKLRHSTVQESFDNWTYDSSRWNKWQKKD